jgi:hypothetical protein
MQQTRLAIGILIVGIMQCLLLLMIAITLEPDQVGAIAHGQFSGMLVGGDGAGRLEPIRDYGFYFQFLMLAQVSLMVALGVNPDRRTPVFWSWLTLSWLAACFVWFKLFAGYEQYLANGETDYIAGFPVAAAWLVYAVWVAGLGLVGIYVFGFKQYVWSDADQAKFDALVKSSSQQS